MSDLSPSVVSGKKIVLAVSGGIAAYKVVLVARELSQLGADVRVVMTRSAERFVGPATFAALTGNPVSDELFGAGAEVPHVELARGADLVVVAPATANTIAKMVTGVADDLMSATLLTLSARSSSCRRCTPRCGRTRPPGTTWPLLRSGAIRSSDRRAARCRPATKGRAGWSSRTRSSKPSSRYWAGSNRSPGSSS